MNFIDRLFGKSSNSSQVAKERLQLVLLQDRVKLPPDTLEKMRDDIIKVISKYVDIDTNGIDISFARADQQNCLVANIPILRTKDPVR